MSLYRELKRRNVFRVATAYIFGAWLIIQVVETIFPAFGAGDAVVRIVTIGLAVGLVPVLIISWALEITPQGLKRERDVDRSVPEPPGSRRTLDFIIILLLILALGFFVVDKYVLEPDRDAELVIETAERARSEALMGEYGDRSIAVLPFINLSDDERNEYFSDGISEELINLLTQINQLRVISRSSAFSFKDKDIDMPSIAEQLDVTYVLEGSVRKVGKQVRITAQLIEAGSDTHLWSETYDRTLDNIFETQDEIAAAVVGALKLKLLGEVPTALPTDSQAYQYFLEAQYFAKLRTAQGMARAIELFKKALEIDSAYAPAWAQLAYTYRWYAGIGGMPREEGNILGDEAVEMALRTDGNYAWAYFVRGQARIFNEFDFAAGVEDWRYALQLDPRNPVIVAAAGTADRVLGRFDAAIDHYRVALKLDPVMPETLYFLGLTCLYSGNLEEAEAVLGKLLTVSPMFAGARYRLAMVLIRRGAYGEALAELQKEDNELYRVTGLAMLHVARSNEAAARQALENLKAQHANRAAYQVAEIYAILGDADAAFQWLERSLELGDSGLASLLGDSAFRSLLQDARWEQFVSRLGLADAWRAMPTEYGGPAQHEIVANE